MQRKQKVWLQLYFISVWKQQEVAIQGVVVCWGVCVQNYCRTASMSLYLLTLLVTSEGFPHTCYFCSISNPNPTRSSLHT